MASTLGDYKKRLEDISNSSGFSDRGQATLDNLSKNVKLPSSPGPSKNRVTHIATMPVDYRELEQRKGRMQDERIAFERHAANRRWQQSQYIPEKPPAHAGRTIDDFTPENKAAFMARAMGSDSIGVTGLGVDPNEWTEAAIMHSPEGAAKGLTYEQASKVKKKGMQMYDFLSKKWDSDRKLVKDITERKEAKMAGQEDDRRKLDKTYLDLAGQLTAATEKQLEEGVEGGLEARKTEIDEIKRQMNEIKKQRAIQLGNSIPPLPEVEKPKTIGWIQVEDEATGKMGEKQYIDWEGNLATASDYAKSMGVKDKPDTAQMDKFAKLQSQVTKLKTTDIEKYKKIQDILKNNYGKVKSDEELMSLVEKALTETSTKSTTTKPEKQKPAKGSLEAEIARAGVDEIETDADWDKYVKTQQEEYENSLLRSKELISKESDERELWKKYRVEYKAWNLKMLKASTPEQRKAAVASKPEPPKTEDIDYQYGI